MRITIERNYASEIVAIVESLRAYKHGGDRKSDQFRNSDDDRLTAEKAMGQMGLKKGHLLPGEEGRRSGRA